jgi:hypothetical protein
MVDEVIHHHAANAGDARHSENFLAAGEQCPALKHVRVAGAGESSARFGGFLVEIGERVLAIIDFWRLIGRAVNRSVVELLS